MRDATDEPARRPGEDTVSGRVFWPIAFLVLALVVGVVVAGFSWYVDERDDLYQRLDDRYVEEIRLQGSGGNRSSRDLVVIDGVVRYDCAERDAVVTCEDDPQPTPE